MRSQRFLAAFAIAHCCAGSAWADEGMSELESLLDENVVTTASATSERASAAPATSVTITAEQLRTHGVRSLAEAIDFLSLGVITSNPLRSPDIGSRGVLLTNDQGRHFLLLVNGHAINDPLYGAARFDQGAGVPIEMIDHIEVAVGPSSVLYGSNAMLGVINVITKTASTVKGGHVVAEYEPGRSYRAGSGAGFTFDLFGAPSELTAGVEYYERFGPDLDFEEQRFQVSSVLNLQFGREPRVWGGGVNDSYFVQAPSGFLRLKSGDFEVMLLASSYRRGIPYSGETVDVLMDDADSYERDLAIRLDVKHQASLSARVSLSSRLYADAFAYQQRLSSPRNSCALSDDLGCTYYDAGRAQWAGLQERLVVNWLGNGNLVTSVGADVRGQWAQTKQDVLQSVGDDLLAPTAGRLDVAGSLISPFVQQTWHPLPWLDLNAGARLDMDSRFSPVVSPRGAVALQPGESTTLKAIYSEAFRAPTWSETDLATFRLAPVGDLKPETVRSVEASIEQRFATQRVLFGVFRSWWSDLVELRPLALDEQLRLQREGQLPSLVAGGFARYRNVASIDNYGLNAGWEGASAGGRLRYGVNVTESFTRRTSGSVEEPLTIAPALFGNARIAYAFDGYLPTPALALSYLGERLEDRARVVGDPIQTAPALATFRLTLTGKIVGGLSYRASAALATTERSPYTAGPTLPNNSTIIPPPLGVAPIDRFNAFFGLRYDFDAGATE